MPSIAENIETIKAQLPPNVQLVAVSKYHPVEKLMDAYDAGQRLFGENHAQQLVAKQPHMPADVQWHFIGHLQTNKVRLLMPAVGMIESIDSLKLLAKVNDEALRAGRTVDVLLQLHVAQETSKTGFKAEELVQAAEQGRLNGMTGIRCCGVMGMATNTPDHALVAHEFQLIRDTFERLRAGAFAGKEHFSVVSMGMSNDWRIAVDHGATLLRIGTAIFGPREY